MLSDPRIGLSVPNAVRDGAPHVDPATVRMVEIRYAATPTPPPVDGRRLVCDAYEATATLIADLGVSPDRLQGREILCGKPMVALKLRDAGLRLGAGRVLAFIPQGLALSELAIALYLARAGQLQPPSGDGRAA